MANGDFREHMKPRDTEIQQKYYDSSEEAWDQIVDFFTDPAHWIVAGIALLLITAGIFTVKFVGAVRAPELPGTREIGVVTLGEDQAGFTGNYAEGMEVIDDSNTVEPMLSGARKEGCYTFLLFGVDKISQSTDTIMVVQYDVPNQKLNLMSIPRDTMINVSWDIKKINSVYSVSGVKGLQKHIGKLIGFVPDYYVRIDLNAFVEVVNLLGGVEFDVPIPMHYHDPEQGLSIDLEPGLQTLDGEQAMGLVRFRKSDRGASGRVSGYDDTGRVQTQQAFLKVMFKKCLEIKNWTKITGYVEIFERNVESDLTLGNMLWFARKAMDLQEDGFTTCTIPCNPYASAWSRSTSSMQSYVTLYGRQVVDLVNESFNPYLSRVTMANLDIMSVNSDGSIASSTGYVADSRAAMPVVQPKSENEDTKPDTEEEETAASAEDEKSAVESRQDKASESGKQEETTEQDQVKPDKPNKPEKPEKPQPQESDGVQNSAGEPEQADRGEQTQGPAAPAAEQATEAGPGPQTTTDTTPAENGE